ncbi:hypothetical protein AMEX_G20902 [Astyanax mexicanus]|uniref:Uncharacterized protein n=1 Tax=Astyanax mexicanus TaxID=7994 RepID=A0A8T2L355_ASTMX|nr:hypothetical protein AMEX_G20902 [Astyanax mexicanus]
MAWVRWFWLQWGTLCPLLALLFAQDSLWDCSEKDSLVEVPVELDMPSECMLGCTALTYRRIMETQDRTTVRFKDSYSGEPEEYCWSTKIKCSVGQKLHRAIIVLPVDGPVENWEPFRLQISSTETIEEILHQHTGPSLLPSDCGLHFQITEQLVRSRAQLVLCVRIFPQDSGSVGTALRCPPFLVTTWKRWNQGEG